MLICQDSRVLAEGGMREHQEAQRFGTYRYLTMTRKREVQKRGMAQQSDIAIDQTHDRRPCVRSCAPEAVDFLGKGEEVIVIQNAFCSRIRPFPWKK
jgi:hypothetical protein